MRTLVFNECIDCTDDFVRLYNLLNGWTTDFAVSPVVADDMIKALFATIEEVQMVTLH